MILLNELLVLYATLISLKFKNGFEDELKQNEFEDDDGPWDDRNRNQSE